MKKYSIIYLSVIALIVLFTGCEKDGSNVIMLANPIAPAIKSLPDLTLERVNATDILEFIGSPVNPGFNSSATYFLEACESGSNFAVICPLLSDKQDTLLRISVSDLNRIFLKTFPANEVSAIDFRIRAVLSIDAGTGVEPMVYTSDIVSDNVTVYGLPRLDLINSGINQKIESVLGDGKYSGYVRLDGTMPFTLKDPDANIVYGANGAALAADGAGITAGANGWYLLSADTQALTYSMSAYMIGLIGSATPNGWNTPDQKMDYDAKSGTWQITVDLIDGEFKFRLNDGWAWNLGGTTDNLTQGGSNIAVTAGNYTIALTIINGTTGKFTIVKN